MFDVCAGLEAPPFARIQGFGLGTQALMSRFQRWEHWANHSRRVLSIRDEPFDVEVKAEARRQALR